MPRGDRTGPNGFGSMTGRGIGFCAGLDAPGYMNPGAGRGCWGRARGSGRGHGHRNMYWATGVAGRVRSQEMGAYPAAFYRDPSVSPVQEAESLKNEVKYMQESIDVMTRRIAELESQHDEGKEKR